METPKFQRRIVLWNRFWLVLVSLYSLYAGYNYLLECFTYNVVRLHLSWSNSATVENEREMTLSINQGGPFVVTHLVKQATENEDKAVAEMKKPLLIYQFKSVVSMRASELAKLEWIEEDGKKALPPRPGQPVTALHYKLLQITTTETASN